MPKSVVGGNITVAAGQLGLTTPSLLLVRAGESEYVVSYNPAAADKGLNFIAPTVVPPTGTMDSAAGSMTVEVLATSLNNTPYFGSRCGEYLIMGNGISSNYVYELRTGEFRTLGGLDPLSPYQKSREVIPPCNSFVVNQAGVLFASGNTTYPNRVWITDTPDSKTPGLIERVRSLQYAFVDVGGTGPSTIIRGLSVVRDYVLVHIQEDGPMLLYAFDTNGAQGWRCRQVNSEFRSSAPNPGCAVDTREDSAYFLGEDCELYRDATTAPASAGETVARSSKILTDRGAGWWNESMVRGSLTTRIAFHARENLMFVLAFSANGETARGLYVLNLATMSYSGPITLPATAMCVTDDALVCILGGKLYHYEVASLGAIEFPVPSAGALSSVQPVAIDPGVSTTEVPRVGVNTSTLTFSETVLNQSYSMPGPLGKMQAGTPTGINLWFNGARLGFFETGYEDFGDPASIKDFVEFHLTLRKNSVCAIGIVAETELGVVRKNWRGLVTNTETLKAFFNMKGRRVRFRVYVISFDEAPCAVLDYSIGWLPGVVK
jgi:hypothetical protein